MKDYGKLYLKVFFIIGIVSLLLAFMVARRTDYTYPFIRVQVGVFVLSAFVTCAIGLFQLEKGISLINIILGYVVLIPAIFLLRLIYGRYLFRFSSLIYIIMVVVGIIYGCAVYVVAKKYKKEVDELNQLIEKNQEDHKI